MSVTHSIAKAISISLLLGLPAMAADAPALGLLAQCVEISNDAKRPGVF